MAITDCSPKTSILRVELEALAERLTSRVVPSHGDASLHNWLHDGLVLYASDFESCGLAHPAFDIGHLAASVIIRSGFAHKGWALVREIVSIYRNTVRVSSNEAAVGILCGLALSAAAAPPRFREFILQVSVENLPILKRL
jgi:thiamine kinase-like enzyme